MAPFYTGHSYKGRGHDKKRANIFFTVHSSFPPHKAKIKRKIISVSQGNVKRQLISASQD